MRNNTTIVLREGLVPILMIQYLKNIGFLISYRNKVVNSNGCFEEFNDKTQVKKFDDEECAYFYICQNYKKWNIQFNLEENMDSIEKMESYFSWYKKNLDIIKSYFKNKNIPYRSSKFLYTNLDSIEIEFDFFMYENIRETGFWQNLEPLDVTISTKSNPDGSNKTCFNIGLKKYTSKLNDIDFNFLDTLMNRIDKLRSLN